MASPVGSLSDEFVMLAVDTTLSALWSKMRAVFVARVKGKASELTVTLSSLDQFLEKPGDSSKHTKDLAFGRILHTLFSEPLPVVAPPAKSSSWGISSVLGLSSSGESDAPNLPEFYEELWKRLQACCEARSQDDGTYYQAALVLLSLHLDAHPLIELDGAICRLLYRHLEIPACNPWCLQATYAHFITTSQWVQNHVKFGQQIPFKECLVEIFARYFGRDVTLEHTKAFLRQNHASWVIDYAREAMDKYPVEHLTRVLKRLPQLKHRSLLQKLRQACLFETTREKSSDCYYKKDKTGLERTCFIDPTIGMFTLSKGKDGLFDVKHTYKRVTEATLVPIEASLPAQRSFQSVNRPERGQVGFEFAKREVEIAKRLTGVQHSVQLLSHYIYRSSKAIGPTPNSVAAFWEPFERENLEDLLAQKVLFSRSEVCAFARQILHVVSFFHANKMIHGDLKPANIVWRYVQGEDGVKRRYFAVCDFGMTVAEDEFSEKGSFFLNGTYGSLLYTAPEALGMSGFVGDSYKAEMWALGLILFRLFFGCYPPWVELVKQCQKDPCSLELKKFLKSKIQEESEIWQKTSTDVSQEQQYLNLRNKLSEKNENWQLLLKFPPEKIFWKDPLIDLIYSLMSFEPATRPNCAEAEKQLPQ